MTLGEVQLIHIALIFLILAVLWTAQYFLQFFVIYLLDREFFSEMMGEIKDGFKELVARLIGAFRRK